MAGTDSVLKFIEKASEDDLTELKALIEKKLNDIRREKVKSITLGCTVQYGTDGVKTGTVVGIDLEGITISAPEFKRNKRLEWGEIYSFEAQ